MVDPALCAKCKGSRRLCGRAKCPILSRIEANIKVWDKIREINSLMGSSPPSVLVGEYGYPRVNVIVNIPPILGPLAEHYEKPEEWWGKKNLEEIIMLRSSLVGSKFSANIKRVEFSRDKMLNVAREIALSVKHVDAEAEFKKPPRPRVMFDGIIEPLGPSGIVKKIDIVSNPVVPRKVDQVVEDYDLRAEEGIKELVQYGISVYQIMRLLSLGMLGRKRERKLVPTRWAITAVDSIVGNLLYSRVRDYTEIDEIRLFTADYIGNHYEIIMLPGSWSFEMIEIWLPNSVWISGDKAYISVNYELHDGKPRIKDVDGGYYAMRMAVLEYLGKIRRQAIVIAIREVRPEYYAPVGVWQVRESVRGALRRGYTKFDDLAECLKAIATRIKTPLKIIMESSYLLKAVMRQEKITKYILDRAFSHA